MDCKREQNFRDFLTAHSIELVYDAQGNVTAVGEGVSPLLQAEVQKRFGKAEVAEMVQGRLI